MAQFAPGQFGTINKSWSTNPTPGILRALMMGQQMRGMKSGRETEELKRKELEQKMMLQAWLMKQAGITPGQGGPMPQATVGPPGVAGQPPGRPAPMMAPQPGGGAGGAPTDPRSNPYMSMLLGVTPYSPEQKWQAGLAPERRTELFETKAGMRPKAGEEMRMAQDLMKWTFDFNQSMKKDDRKAANKILENIGELAVKLQEFGSPFAATAQQLLNQFSEQYKRITGVAPKISLGVPPRGTKQAMTMSEKKEFEQYKTTLTRRGDVIRTMLTLWTKTAPGSESEKALMEGLASTLGMKVEEMKTSNPFKWALEAVGFWNPELAFKLKGPSGGAPSPPGSPGQVSPAGPPEGPITPTSRIKGETVQDWYNRLVDTQNLKPEEALSVLSAGGVKLESKRGGAPGVAEAGPPVGPPVGQMPPPPPGPMALPGPITPPGPPTGPPPPPPRGPGGPGAEVHPLLQMFQWIMSQRGSRDFRADEQAMMKMLTPGPEYQRGVRERAMGRGLN